MISLECLIHSKLWAMAAGYSLECLIHSKLWAIAAGYSQKSMREKKNLVFADHLNWRGGYGFLFRSEHFCRTTRELEYLFFLSRKARNFLLFSTLGYMTKTLNQIIFFFLHQNQNIFFSNIGNQNIFLEKNHNPPLQVKWSFPKWFPYLLLDSIQWYIFLIMYHNKPIMMTCFYCFI
jgi:hypothetical protein